MYFWTSFGVPSLIEATLGKLLHHWGVTRPCCMPDSCRCRRVLLKCWVGCPLNDRTVNFRSFSLWRPQAYDTSITGMYRSWRQYIYIYIYKVAADCWQWLNWRITGKLLSAWNGNLYMHVFACILSPQWCYHFIITCSAFTSMNKSSASNNQNCLDSADSQWQRTT